MPRINQWLARATGLSRRAADASITAGEVTINGQLAVIGQAVSDKDSVTFRGQEVSLPKLSYIVLNKPTGYVSSRRPQGQDRSIYDLLPEELHGLKSVGRLDKDSSGLLILTNDGDLAQELTHPRHHQPKTYRLILDKPLTPADHHRIEEGVLLDDGISQFNLAGQGKAWQAILAEGRNRQIRRTFEALGLEVIELDRTSIGKLQLGDLGRGQFKSINPNEIL